MKEESKREKSTERGLTYKELAERHPVYMLCGSRRKAKAYSLLGKGKSVITIEDWIEALGSLAKDD